MDISLVEATHHIENLDIPNDISKIPDYIKTKILEFNETTINLLYILNIYDDNSNLTLNRVFIALLAYLYLSDVEYDIKKEVINGFLAKTINIKEVEDENIKNFIETFISLLDELYKDINYMEADT